MLLLEDEKVIAELKKQTAKYLAMLDEPILTDFFHRKITDSKTIIHCVNWDVDPAVIAPNRDLVIFAEKLSISNKLIFQGCSVFIHAREITFKNAMIDVSGVDEPGYLAGDRAQDGRDTGQGGTDGQQAKDGKNAGKVKIIAGHLIGSLTLKANGGAGGRGQDGGDGARGAGRSREWRSVRDDSPRLIPLKFRHSLGNSRTCRSQRTS
jgi:hypothetical protein